MIRDLAQGTRQSCAGDKSRRQEESASASSRCRKSQETQNSCKTKQEDDARESIARFVSTKRGLYCKHHLSQRPTGEEINQLEEVDRRKKVSSRKQKDERVHRVYQEVSWTKKFHGRKLCQQRVFEGLSKLWMKALLIEDTTVAD